MATYIIENGKKVEVKKKVSKKKKQALETKAQKDRRLGNEIKGMFNNLGMKV